MGKLVGKTCGCRYCGKQFDEIDAGDKARESGCCQECFVERFATDDEKEQYAKQKQYEKETATRLSPARVNFPGRIDSSKVKIKKVVYE
mgnify:CR=1 FL=1